MESLRIVFIISDFELDVKTCDDCQIQQKKHTFLSMPKFAAEVLRHIVETLSSLRTLYSSPDNFQGHICWNFAVTTSSTTRNRNISEWYEFQRAGLEKLRDFLLQKCNSCSCFSNRNAENVRISTPFNWQSLSTSVRDCLMQCRWSDRIAMTPKKFTLGQSAMDNVQNTTNHIVIFGGLPSQPDILSEFDGRDGIEKLMQRLLIIGDNPSNKAVQTAAAMFEKKQVCLSVVALPSIEHLVVTPTQRKYAHIVHRAIRKISKGSFTLASTNKAGYLSEYLQVADHCGTFTEKYFQNILKSRSEDCENQQHMAVEWIHDGKVNRGVCVIRSSADPSLKKAVRTEITNNLLVISDVETVSELPNSWMFSVKPFCFGLASTTPHTRFKNFIGTVELSPLVSIRPSGNVVISFLPRCNDFLISYLENSFAYNAEKSSHKVDLKSWFATVCSLEQPSYLKKQSSDKLPYGWRESLVPTLDSYTHASPSRCTSPVSLYQCSLKEATGEYRKYFKRLLGGMLSPEGNVPDTIQRALSTSGLKLKDFLADEQLWHGPAQFTKLIGDCKNETMLLQGVGAALHFQFETAFVMGELENTKTPPLGLRDENPSDDDESFEDSIFEIVNLLRWAVGHYPDAAASANQSLEKRVRAGCRFAEMVYAELRRDLVPADQHTMSPPAADVLPKLKRHSFDNSRKSLVDEYKTYAKRYAAAASSTSSLRFMRADDWAAVDDRYFVPETPEKTVPHAPVEEEAEFVISETPIKAVGSTSTTGRPIERSLSKRTRKIERLQMKLEQVRRRKASCKTPSEVHACLAEELQYSRRLNVLTHASHVKRQLFPELGQWYSSEDSGSSDD